MGGGGGRGGGERERERERDRETDRQTDRQRQRQRQTDRKTETESWADLAGVKCKRSITPGSFLCSSQLFPTAVSIKLGSKLQPFNDAIISAETNGSCGVGELLYDNDDFFRVEQATPDCPLLLTTNRNTAMHRLPPLRWNAPKCGCVHFRYGALSTTAFLPQNLFKQREREREREREGGGGGRRGRGGEGEGEEEGRRGRSEPNNKSISRQGR